PVRPSQFRLPGGTTASLLLVLLRLPDHQGPHQDIARRVLVPVQHQPTAGPTMRPGAERLLDQRAAARTGLGRVLGRHREEYIPMQSGIVAHPDEEARPGRIAEAFGQMVSADEVADLQGFIGNQVARPDKRACRFAGEVFALPLDMQTRMGQALPGSLAVAGSGVALWAGARRGARVGAQGWRGALGSSVRENVPWAGEPNPDPNPDPDADSAVAACAPDDSRPVSDGHWCSCSSGRLAAGGI